jgi:penicillin-binding protein 2
LPTHAWFIGFAPYEDPKIAVVVFVFGGGDGSAVAVPIAHEILDYYFSRDLEEDTP